MAAGHNPYRARGPGALTPGPAALLGFAYGATSNLHVQFHGQLYLSEIVALGALVLAGGIGPMARSRALGAVAAGYGLMLFGLVLADIANAGSAANALRGWANTGFALVNVLFLAAILHRDLRALSCVLLGMAAARLLSVDAMALASAALDGGNAFKVRVVPVATPLLLVLSHRLARRSAAAAEGLLLAAAALYLLSGARSMGLVLGLAALWAFVQRVPVRGGQRLAFCAVLPLAGYALYAAYVDHVLAGGVAGNAFDQLMRAANPYNPLSLLAQGRSEIRVALAAIAEAPVLGHGSWAQDTGGRFAVMWADMLGRDTVVYVPRIVAHSVVLTAWLWGGIAGAIGIALVVGTVIRCGASAMRAQTAWRPVIAVLVVDFLWNACFSPVGHLRTSFPLAIAASLVLAARPGDARGRGA